MSTLSQLRSRISNKLSAGNLVDPTSAEIDDQINSVIKFYSSDEFWFNEQIVSLTATTDSAVLTGLPADFQQEIVPNGLVLIDNSIPHPLTKITPAEYDSMDSGTTGLPNRYIYRAGNFELLNYPDQAYTINLFYRKNYATLVNDDDTNDFTNYAERLIEYKTLSDLFGDYKDDDKKALFYDAKSLDEFNAVKKQTYNLTSTGVLVTENIV